MSKLRVHSFSISLDGYGAGPNQGPQNPLGEGGIGLHEWAYPTRTFQRMVGNTDGATGIDNDFQERGVQNIGSWILGRNMFGPIRGDWPDENWRGWWGDNPPYHVPVFVLTHHPRPSFSMNGGTTFHFITDGIEAALDRAMDAADGKDVRVGGGVATIREYLQARLIDEMHVAVTAKLLGAGEHLLGSLNLPELGYRVSEQAHSEQAMHVVLTRG